MYAALRTAAGVAEALDLAEIGIGNPADVS